MTMTDHESELYAARCRRTYAPGDLVRVGPAYRMGGTQEHDGHEGLHRICERIGASPDYKLARVDRNGRCDPGTWDVIVCAARLDAAVTRVPARLEPFGKIGWTVFDCRTPEAAAHFVARNPDAAMPCWRRWDTIDGQLLQVR